MCYQILGICGRYWIRYCDKYCTILQVTNLKTLVYKVNKFLKLKTLSSDKLSETIKATYFICDNPYKATNFLRDKPNNATNVISDK